MKTAFIYTIFQRWAFIAAVVLLILMNYLSNALPFGGQTAAQASAKYPTLITPSGYAFAIWGLIYLTLAIFAVFQLQRGRDIRFYRIIWRYFIINALANVLWLVAFQNDFVGLSVLIMALILTTLILIFRIFYRIRGALSTSHRYFFQVPFSMYFGWICVAAIVNVAAFLYSLNIDFLMDSEQLIAIVMLVVGAMLALAVLLSYRDYIFVLVFGWAYIAIWIAQRDASMQVGLVAKYTAIALLSATAVHFIADRIRVARYGRSVS